MQDIGQGDIGGIAHICVPALAGIAQAQRPAFCVALVGEDHHLWNAGCVVFIGDIDLQRAQAGAEGGDLRRVHRLARRMQHAMAAQTGQQRIKIRPVQRPGQIDIQQPCTEA